MVPKFLHPLFAAAFIAFSCSGGVENGNVSSGGLPVLTRTSPNSAPAGSAIDVFGVGFSLVAQENIVLVGGMSAVASSYRVTDEGEEVITFSIPTGASRGEGSLLVVVEGETSNSLNFTVAP